MSSLRLLVLGCAVVVLQADCGRPASSSRPEFPPKGFLSPYAQAPVLDERVADGAIPPIAARLPKNPLIVQPVERIGEYGGTLRLSMVQGDTPFLIRTIAYENLVQWDPQWRRVIPNVAESYEVNEDATVYTFRLRRGLRWSDGERFTSRDIVFWYETAHRDPEIAPRTSIQDFEVEAPDDFTVSFRLASPNGLFLEELASAGNTAILKFPAHYLERFHPKLHPEGPAAVDEMLRREGFTDWRQLLASRAWPAPGLPTLGGWVLERSGPEKMVARRNPFYWKIDPAGNQLPYIDRVEFRLVTALESFDETREAGGVDVQVYHLAVPAHGVVPGAELDASGYRWIQTIPTESNRLALSLNLTHPDPAKRELFGNQMFRIALSHAIDRRRIIERVFRTDDRPYQVAPRPESSFYHERLATQYLRHDVAKANALLDGIGLVRRDADGFRLGARERRVAIELLAQDELSLHRDALASVAADWRRVGIDVRVVVTDSVRFGALVSENRHDAVAWTADGGLDVLLTPRFFFPAGTGSFYAVPWGAWFRNPEDPGASTPRAPAREQMRLYREILHSPSPEHQTERMRRILDIAAEEFYVIGISIRRRGRGVISKRLRNVPDTMPAGWSYPHPAPTNPSQYFFDEPAKARERRAP